MLTQTYVDSASEKELAKRIAQYEWPIQGTACRDPVSKTRWRRVRHGWYDESNGRGCSDNLLVQRAQLDAGDPDCRGYELLARALAEGPDVGDDATILALALHLPYEHSNAPIDRCRLYRLLGERNENVHNKIILAAYLEYAEWAYK